MLSFFKASPLIESSSAEWIFDTYAWALNHFDCTEFYQRSRLVQPSNEFFSGRVDSVRAKAENIFQHTLNYTGLQHWPFQLQEPQQFQNCTPPLLELEKIERYSVNITTATAADAINTKPLAKITADTLTLTYNPQQTLKPGDLAASLAHAIAQHLVMQSRQLPPGGADYLIEATELIGIFMGFGVLFANSAYTFRGSCASCFNASANRQATLSEDEVIFSLALYCRLKNISNAKATVFLKSHLKSTFKKASKQIDNNPDQLQRLLKICTTEV